MNDSNKPFIEESSVREQDEKQKKKKQKKRWTHFVGIVHVYLLIMIWVFFQ